MERALVGVLALLFSLGMALAPPEARGAPQIRDAFVGKTDAKVIELELCETRGAVRFALHVEVSSGTLLWALYDPAGRLRAEGQAGEGGNIFRSEHSHPARGAWRLEIVRRNVTGSYRVEWAAGD